jgi:hypothetical protein
MRAWDLASRWLTTAPVLAEPGTAESISWSSKAEPGSQPFSLISPMSNPQQQWLLWLLVPPAVLAIVPVFLLLVMRWKSARSRSRRRGYGKLRLPR